MNTEAARFISCTRNSSKRVLADSQIDRLLDQTINHFDALKDAIPQLCEHCLIIVKDNIERSSKQT
jgi:CRISPR-associated protein Cas8b1/Cst1 subtype I-B